MARLDDFGLRGLVMESGKMLSPGEDRKRFERTQTALEAYRKEAKHPNDIAKFYEWLRG